MNKFLLSLAACLIFLQARSQNGHRIQITLKPYSHSKVYLGYYYGKLKALADSAMLDASGKGSFSGKELLPGGVYFVVSPARVILFELLIDKGQDFAVAADTANLPGSVVFTGSNENVVFQSYTRFTNKTGAEITAAQKELATARTRADSARLTEKMRKANLDIQHYREELSAKYPSSLLATLFHTMKEPVVPPVPAAAKGGARGMGPSGAGGAGYDSLFAYHFYKAHFWDSISFTDERLLRTPVFEPRLDKYFRNLVPPQADSIEREADNMLLESRTSKAMFQYLMVYFVQKYVNPEYMGQDAVFVHLFEKYINAGQADFFTEKYREFLNNRAYSLMANLIGQPAPNLEMVDSSGRPQPLYGVDAPFILICFWDPTCGHCKEVVPKVDSIFQAKWKKEGVKVYGVMVDGGKEAWLQFIRDHNLKDWMHVYETRSRQDSVEAAGQPGYKQLYDVYQTPILYLLDKNKNIIAKKLSYQQFDEVIDLKIRNAKSN
ncbi:MAG TPA: thioredoxin-like domain-containing protein [Puia sp.]|nr:thioredoxin-like domain-containing protein [Puia sp.]